MIFRTGEKEYRGSSAVEIIQALQGDAVDGKSQGLTLRQFLRLSLAQLSDRIPLRELDVSDRLNDEMLALSYLYLRDEYGTGEFLDAPNRSRLARLL